MSEKRQRQTQRRKRRSNGHPRSASSQRAGRAAGDAGAKRTAEAEREMALLLDGMAEIAAAGADEPVDALEAEEWASGLVGTWRQGLLPDPEVDRLFGPGLVRALERIGTAGALATLRALAAVGADAYAANARAAADRLATSGVPEPSWSHDLGRRQPTAALLMHDDTFDDGVSVLVEFAVPEGEPHTLGVYIDHNLGGLVKDVFVAGPLAEVREQLAGSEAEEAGAALRELGLPEARARVERAIEMLDHTLDPPVDEDVRPLRALIAARMRLLPSGGEAPGWDVEVAPEERERLLADFLAAPEGRRWRGDREAADLARAAIEFGADYNHGGPLRWSPVVVEIFMTSWLPRKVVGERAYFERMPAVLRDWVTCAGHRRGVPSAALREAVAAVELYRAEMLEAVEDPEAGGPAKAFAQAARSLGVDLSDPAAVGEFIERYNDGLAA